MTTVAAALDESLDFDVIGAWGHIPSESNHEETNLGGPELFLRKTGLAIGDAFKSIMRNCMTEGCQPYTEKRVAGVKMRR
mmetsp:Transcript_33555/g.50041  ORF Transcript_33555/g.50041 Transcript_33555/m.50041 type:complete len:80 (+) Transcript_33555:56-295(+)|eukprot:14798088-Ditylum_brightwellii.AAC.1